MADQNNINNNNNQTTPNLCEASEQWAQVLSEVARSINLSASDLQDDWADLSEESQGKGEPPLPDPIKLLRRIHALDNSARLLQQECGHMMQRRKNAVLEATKYLVHLRELCHTEPFANVSTKIQSKEPERVAELERNVFDERRRYCGTENA